jgi:hypothetical protein
MKAGSKRSAKRGCERRVRLALHLGQLREGPRRITVILKSSHAKIGTMVRAKARISRIRMLVNFIDRTRGGPSPNSTGRAMETAALGIDKWDWSVPPRTFLINRN